MPRGEFVRPVHCSVLACLRRGRLRAGIRGIRICAAIMQLGEVAKLRVQEPAFGFGPQLGGFAVPNRVCWKDEYGLQQLKKRDEQKASSVPLRPHPAW